MKKIYLFLVALVMSYSSWSQVSVTATAGTTAPTAYPTVSAAFAAINAGTHQGSILISITGNTTEPAGMVSLLKSATPSDYTDITIRPSGGSFTINSAATPTANRAIIELQGADNVTIDGDDPGTAGAQNLTIQAATSTNTGVACIRISSNSTTGTDGATNIVVKNCNFVGSRNSGTSNTVNYGINFSNYSTTSMTSGAYGNTNVTIQNNNVTRCYYGIYANGASASYSNTGLQILNNTVGSSTLANNVGIYGIFLSYTSTNTSGGVPLVSGNDVRNGDVSASGSGWSGSISGIYIGSGCYGAIVEKNNIHDVMQPSSSGYGAYGINILTNSDVIIRNNFIRDIVASKYSTGVTSSFCNYGIYSASAQTGLTIAHNTVVFNVVNVTGSVVNSNSACLFLSSTSSTLTQIVNNIFINNNISTSALCFYSGSGILTAPLVNNNSYYSPNGSIGYYNSLLPTLTNWQNTTGKDANSFNVLPPFVSATDLHLTAAAQTPLESGGIGTATTGIMVDFDGNVRPGPSGSVNGGATAPDIGADEFDGTPFVLPSVASSTTLSPIAGQCTASSHTLTASVSSGTAPIASVTLNYSINGVAQTPIAMTGGTASGTSNWTATIPAASPGNAVIAYSVTVTTSASSLNTATGGNGSYFDEPLTGLSLVATANVASLCAGNPAILTASLSGTAAPTTYPVPSVSVPTTNEDIGSLSISSGGNLVFSNNSYLNNLTGSIGTATGTAGSYSDFTALSNIKLTASTAYDISISSITSASAYNNILAAFIDYNRDGDFEDAGELIYIAPYVSGAHTSTGTFTVPANCSNGATRLRVLVKETTTPFSTYSGIGAFSYGEYEDYTVNLINFPTYAWSNGTATISSTNPTTVNPTATTTYTATATTAAGCVLTSNPLTITSNPIPTAPTAANSTQCGSHIPTASVASTSGTSGTGTYNWYSAASGGNLLQGQQFNNTLATWYSDNYSGTVPSTGGTLGGVANIANGALELQPNVASSGGNIVINASGANANMFNTEFDVTLTTGGTSMADGFSYCFGDDVIGLSNTTTPLAERGSGSKLRVLFMTYNGSGNNAKGVYLIYNTNVIDFSPTANGVLGYSNNVSWIPTAAGSLTSHVAVSINAAGQATVSVGGTPLFTNVQLPPAFLTENKATWKHAISSRSGGVTGGFSLDNLVLQKNGTIPGSTTYLQAVSTTTTFYVSEVGVNGCESPRAPVTVTVNTPPAITVSPNATICNGLTTNLSASSSNANYTYVWTPGNLAGANQTIAPTASTTYTVTASDNTTGNANSGCSITATTDITVNPASPSVVVSPSAATLTCGNTSMLTATGGILATHNVFGTGTTTNTTTGYPAPFTNYWGGTKHQMLILASELNALGILPNSQIDSIAFNITSVGSTFTGSLSNFQIDMANTTTSALTSSSFVGSLTNVRPASALTVPTSGLPLNLAIPITPFTWDGTSNLVIQTSYSNVNSGATSDNVQMAYTATPFVSCNYFYDDNATAATVLATASPSSSSSNRPNMILSIKSALPKVWSPTSGLYTDAAATTPYTGGNADTVYAKPYVSTIYSSLTTNSYGCNNYNLNSTANITVNKLVNLGNDTTICSGNTLTLNAGTLGSTYSWSTGASTQQIQVTTSGTYIATVTNGTCVDKDTIVVTVLATPVVNLGNDTNICSGNTLTLNAGAANSTYAKLWSTSATTQTIPVTTAGTYIVTVSNGICVKKDTIVVSVTTTPVVNLGNDTNICSGATLTLNAGTSNATYAKLWSTSATTQTIPVTTAGTYSLTVTNGQCVKKDTIIVSVTATPVVNLGNDTNICSGNTLTLNAGAANSTYTKLWSTSATTQTIPVTAAGTYSVTVTNGQCVKKDTIIVSVTQTPVVNLGNDTNFCSGNTLTLNSGTSNATYAKLWSTSATTQTIPVTNSGTYSLTVTNGQCIKKDTIVVTVTTMPTVNLGADTAFCSGDTLTLDAGAANSTYTKLWSTSATTQTIDVTTTGNYIVSVTNGICVKKDTIMVNVLTTPTVNLGNDTAICNGSILTLNAGAANALYTKHWNTGATSQSINVSTAGAYYVTVGTGSCANEDTIVVSILPTPVVNLGNDTSICSGTTLTLNAGAANAAFTKLWSNGTSNLTLPVSTAGTYSVTVTDGLCSKKDTIVVGITQTPVVNLGADTGFCTGSTLVLNAGNPTYSKLWNTGATTQTINVGTVGIYSVAVTNGLCVTKDTINIVENPLPIVDLGNDTAFCQGNSIILDAGNPGAMYAWNTGANTQTVTAASSGNYKVTVTNGFNCKAKDSVLITVDPFASVASIYVTGTSPDFFFSTVNPTNVSTFDWDFGDGTTGTGPTPQHSYIPSNVDQVYTVTLVVDNPCGAQTLTYQVTVKAKTTGINDLKLNANMLKLYPNPALESVTIENASDLHMKHVVISNVLGQQVASIPVTNNAKQVIQIAQLVSGLYNVSIEFEEGTVSRKLEIIK